MRLIVLIFLFSIAVEAKDKIVSFNDGDQKWSYICIDIQGWDVFIEEPIKRDKKLFSDIKRQFEKDLKKITLNIPNKALTFLKSVKIWVSSEKKYPFRSKELGVFVFHRSRNWLSEHGLNPDMAGGIHMINPDKVLYHHKVFEWGPMTLLHELSHAYHWVHLGDENILIKKAFESSVKHNLYREVPSRSKPTRLVKAYASSNMREYFAELTEAYFGNNDYYPKTKRELRKYDSTGFKMIEAVWGITK
ncbi:hypothetical protein HBN50_14480 [Halobacteriovorax sp. GB3]|uniref:hypothetical protein n=1 Tax=Halobacteriovorax sp. GB3 TaxID=2719615 RepID=UPI00235FAAA3|nr:hypothetical protein [Halobacteriovorax sp. GB3]MDD0854315.1 hypothetical protein [Halobacteriovorax sp. GB3]